MFISLESVLKVLYNGIVFFQLWLFQKISFGYLEEVARGETKKEPNLAVIT